MNKIKITNNIIELIDKYFTERTNKTLENSNSIIIRQSIEKRIGECLPKSLLNEILIGKDFKYERIIYD